MGGLFERRNRRRSGCRLRCVVHDFHDLRIQNLFVLHLLFGIRRARNLIVTDFQRWLGSGLVFGRHRRCGGHRWGLVAGIEAAGHPQQSRFVLQRRHDALKIAISDLAGPVQPANQLDEAIELRTPRGHGPVPTVSAAPVNAGWNCFRTPDTESLLFLSPRP